MTGFSLSWWYKGYSSIQGGQFANFLLRIHFLTFLSFLECSSVSAIKTFSSVYVLILSSKESGLVLD